jgi:hypothetical protein
MNETVRKILEDAGVDVEPDRAAQGFAELVDERAFDGADFIAAVTPFRRFLKIGAEPAGRVRASREFYEAFLGHGRAGAEALLAAYQEALPDCPNPQDVHRATWSAVAVVARVAERRGCIRWNLNTWKPADFDPAKAKVVGRVPVEVAEAARCLAFATRRTLSAVVEDALRAEVARFEKKSGPLPTRAAPEKRQAEAATA